MTHIWHQSVLNGGGYIEGILQNPQNPNVLFARSDVAGIFRSVDRGRSWQACNNGMNGYHAHDTRSFAMSPHDSHILYRGCGSVRGGDFFGSIYKSIDNGDSWFWVSDAVDFYGNGEARQYGEVIQVSPHHPDCVVASGYTKGVWKSDDAGNTWQYMGLKDERITCLAFHPDQENVLYAGTLGSIDKNPLYVEQQYDYVRPNPARLYRSDNNGVTWAVLYEGMDFVELVFDRTNSATIHAACMHDGVKTSHDGGYTWVNDTAQLSKYEISTVALDPHNNQRLFAAAMTFPNFDPEVPPIGLYTSENGGQTWRLVKWHTNADVHHYPSYMTLPYTGWAVSKIRVDCQDSQILFMSNWYGVSISHDGGLTWDANFFEGLENVCIENLTVHPSIANTVYMVTADHNPKVSTDGGKTFGYMPHAKVTKVQPDSTAIVASRFNPDFVLYGVKGSGGCSIIRATTTGERPQVVLEKFGTPDTAPAELAFQSRAAAVSVQALIEDPFVAGTFYAYLDGIISVGAGIYQTTDWGDTWEILGNAFPPSITRIPHERHWIENELLSVVIAQTKNVCGTNQLMCADPHKQGTLYVGEWTEGLFRTIDGGKTWQNIGQSLPFKREPASVLNVIRADINHAGILYAGFIREGLWQSTDFGDSWRKIFPLDDSIYNATSVDVGGSDGQLIVICCEPLYYAPCPSSVMISRDGGNTWEDVYDKQFGALRWKSVVLEPHQNRAYLATCGNSAYYLDL